MSARDYVPFMILGVILTPIAFILLASLKSPEILALILLLVSSALSALFGKKRSIKFVLTGSFIASSISLMLSFLMLGFALMAEQHSILKVGKIQNGTGCVYISEEEMKRYPTLKRAIEIADKEGEAKLSISSREVERIRELTHGRWCIIYRGEFYGISVMTV